MSNTSIDHMLMYLQSLMTASQQIPEIRLQSGMDQDQSGTEWCCIMHPDMFTTLVNEAANTPPEQLSAYLWQKVGCKAYFIRNITSLVEYMPLSVAQQQYAYFFTWLQAREKDPKPEPLDVNAYKRAMTLYVMGGLDALSEAQRKLLTEYR